MTSITVTPRELVRRAREKFENPSNTYSYQDFGSALDEVLSEIKRDLDTLRDAVEERFELSAENLPNWASLETL
jgi:hypothetical protein